MRLRGPVPDVVRVPLWRLRLHAEAARYLVAACALAGLVSSARLALAPPLASLPAGSAPAAPLDRAGEAFAELFARRYLSWSREGSEAELEPYASPSSEQSLGRRPASGTEQGVVWTEVVGDAVVGVRHVFTVAVQTTRDGLVYLSVPVERSPAGAPQLAELPAIVGAPRISAADTSVSGPQIQDEELAQTLTRAVRNFVDGNVSDLGADFSPGLTVPPAPEGLQLVLVNRISWSRFDSAALVTVRAHDVAGTEFELAYECGVQLVQGRWSVNWIQTARHP